MKSAFLSISVVISLAACSTTNQPFMLNNQVYYGSDPALLSIKDAKARGVMPQTIHCRKSRPGDVSGKVNWSLTWTKAPKPYRGWTILNGTSATIKEQTAREQKAGLRKVSGDSYYDKDLGTKVYCQIWRAV